ncbi:S8 family serine peptidase [Chryseobacterium sp. ERMR1:04]|uniref:S8 family serine peptidase n=1 Tax=Chryseobacterium sp. ERMR1:04 TaxID=1705393 RepID=UPI0006C855F7|nr:S8 family serine peptidase [Chryseobacterium sp. ERMR1:04]KPH12877.1 hypothetical protein AMQ68_14585 [Chryseobacterium sp. ERMR1:04]
MKNKILPLFLFVGFFGFGQNKLYYLEIPNKDNVPKVISTTDGKVIATHNDQKVSDLFSKYEIVKLEQAFPTAKNPYLKTIYLLETNSSNLINELKNYKQYFPYSEETYKPELLYTPNDYNYPSGSSNPHKNLDLINIKEAWDYTHGDPKFKIGISDTPIRATHEDLVGKITSLTNYITPDSHGTAVASHAAANTDNNKGIPGTGFNSSVLFKSMNDGGLINTLLVLSQNGARVVNASWHTGIGDYCPYSSIEQTVMDEIHNNGTVIVAAAGNGKTCGGPNNYVYPASYNHVVSISTVGHEDVGYVYNNLSVGWKDRVEQVIGDPNSTHQNNDMVDLRVGAFNVLGATAESDSSYGGAWGTSLGAPQASGIVALLFAVNNCLNTDEIESILKLTSARLDNIPENQPYIGKLGAGRIDAGKATKMAWQMNPSNGGEVIIEDRSFDKWHFELLNSPEKIILRNQSFTDNADIVFRAKNYILLEGNVLLKPGPDKSDYLYISNENTCYNFKPTFNPSNIITNKKADFKQETYSDLQNNDISIYPIPAKENIFIKSNIDFNTAEIKIYDGNGRLVQQNLNNNKNNIISINLSKLVAGNYILDILFDGKKHYSKKIVKQ